MNNYFFEHEATQFSFFLVPQGLFTKKYKNMDCKAKILYSILLNRNSLSIKNNWVDDSGKVFIYFDRGELMEMLQIGKDSLIKLFKQLEEYNLLDVIRQGQGRANKLYVRKFIETVDTTDKIKMSKKSTSKSLKNRIQEVEKIDTNNTELNNTELNNKTTTIVAESTIKKYKLKIKKVIGNTLKDKDIIKLLKKGESNLDYYLDNWNSFSDIKINNIAAFFIKAVLDGYEIPKQSLNSNGLDNMNNFECRELQEGEYDKYYYKVGD